MPDASPVGNTRFYGSQKRSHGETAGIVRVPLAVNASASHTYWRGPRWHRSRGSGDDGGNGRSAAGDCGHWRRNLAESLGFYRGIVGMDVVAQGPWRGIAFARHWRMPPETNATAVLLQGGGHAVGQIMLLDFKDPRRRLIREEQQRHLIGLTNLAHQEIEWVF